MPPAVEAWSLNHWTTREVPRVSLYQTFGLTLSAGIQTGTTWGDMESDESPRCPQTWQDHPGWVLLPHPWGVQSLNLINAASDAHVRALVKWCIQRTCAGPGIQLMLNVCSFLPAPGRSESHSDEDDMRRLGCTADFISGVTIPKCSWGQTGTRNKEGCPGKILTFHRETAFLVSLYYVGNMQKNFFFFF